MNEFEKQDQNLGGSEDPAIDRRPEQGPPPRVTVLMTYYNKGAHVLEAVQSVLANTFTDLEVLLVDDGSTDNGLATVRALNDPRIRILESAVNTGRAGAANRGLDAARGEYIAVLDADDVMNSERIAKQVALLDADPSVGVCGSWAQVLGEPDRVIPMYATDRECRGVMLFGMPVIYPAATFRRSVIEAHALRCVTEWRLPGMDFLFALAVGLHSAYANIQEVLLEYRMGDNNMRHGRDPMGDRFALEQAALQFFGIPASDEEVDLHLAFHRMMRKPFDAARTRALWAWKEKLIAWNREHLTFTPDIFEAELERRWNKLFHLLCDHGAGAALAHLRLSGGWSASKLIYLAKLSLRGAR